MHADVTAFAYEWQHGSRHRAQEIARRFVEENGEYLERERLPWYNRDGLVKNVEALRIEGKEEAALICEMYVQVKFAPTQAERLYRGDELPDLSGVGDESEWDSFEELWRRGHRDLAKRFADDFVGFYREELKVLHRYTLEDLVLLCESYRAVGRLNEVTVVEMWLKSEYEPQSITGYFDVRGIANGVDAAMRRTL
jgi:hypothetical protein